MLELAATIQEIAKDAESDSLDNDGDDDQFFQRAIIFIPLGIALFLIIILLWRSRCCKRPLFNTGIKEDHKAKS